MINAIAPLVTMIGIDSIRIPYTTKATEPASDSIRKRTTEVIANDATTSAEAR